MTTWMQTKSGRPFDLIHPRAIEVDFAEIAYSLGQINRFTGHAERPLSVALHTLTVARILSNRAIALTGAALRRKGGEGTLVSDTSGLTGHGLICALLHDAKEAYIGDDSTPKKRAEVEIAREIGGDNAAEAVIATRSAMESRVDDAIYEASGVRGRQPGYPDAAALAAVKDADTIALMMERRDFMARPKRRWDPALEAIPLPRWHIDWMPGPQAAEELYRAFQKHLPALWPGHNR